MELVTKAASLINLSASSAAGGVGASLNGGEEPKCLYKRLYMLTPADTYIKRVVTSCQTVKHERS